MQAVAVYFLNFCLIKYFILVLIFTWSIRFTEELDSSIESFYIFFSCQFQFVFVLLLEKHRARKRYRTEYSHILVDPQNDLNNQDWARAKLVAWNSIRASHEGVRNRPYVLEVSLLCVSKKIGLRVGTAPRPRETIRPKTWLSPFFGGVCPLVIELFIVRSLPTFYSSKTWLHCLHTCIISLNTLAVNFMFTS